MSMWKDAQHVYPQRECKSKLNEVAPHTCSDGYYTKDGEQQALAKFCVIMGTLVYCWWLWKISMKRRMSFSQNVNHNYHMIQHSWRDTWRNKSNTNACIHSIILHNSQQVEAAKLSTNSWMDKQNMVCSYTRLLLSQKEVWNSDTWYKMDKLWKHGEWAKPGTKVQMLHDFTYMRDLE